MGKQEEFFGMSKGSAGFRLGIDVGSVSVKCVVADRDGAIVFSRYLRSSGRPVSAAFALLSTIVAELGPISFTGAVVTGSGKELLAKPLGLDTVNEILAHATAGWRQFPAIRHIIEIGGQDSKYITIGQDRQGRPFLEDHRFNQLCAAGTGAFLDQQAVRLGLSVEELGTIAVQAASAANVAGRCAVFAKSDMIHLQQKAVPVEDIAAGLCLALARNFLSTLCQGKRPEPPILFQGGVAANQGVVEAFRDLLALREDELIIPEHHQLMGALGSAIIAETKPQAKPIQLGELLQTLADCTEGNPGESSLPPIRPSTEPIAGSDSPESQTSGPPPYFLGLDIGSVSTKGVLIDSAGQLICSHYGPTASRPVDALRTCMASMAERFKGQGLAAHVAATGSGRHLARAILGGGSVIDEISAQALSCRHHVPGADTIFEIGGQDSKFIRLRNGEIETFKMNRACAAGTGAFLEEQAGRIEVRIAEEFADRAFSASKPARLGSRCTVFMDSDLVHHLQQGAPIDDLCAGLAYSIAENYLEKVVGSAKIGASIVFQGGVAKNDAILAVFSQLLGRTVQRHPFPELSGAFGAALTAREEYLSLSPAHAVPLDLQLQASLASFTCRQCDNVCEIRKLTAHDGVTACFGGLCGRYEQGKPPAEMDADPFTVREKLLHECVTTFGEKGDRGIIGFPFALTLHDHLPFWQTLFNALGFSPILSDPTRAATVETGASHCPGDFCSPMKVLFGHVHTLIDRGITTLFIPQMRMIVPPGEMTPRYGCPYTQAAPFIVRENIPKTVSILTLELPLETERDHWLGAAGNHLGISRDELTLALDAALAAQQEFVRRCREAGRHLLDELQRDQRRGAVLLGRPYNSADRHLNLNLARRLQQQNIVPIPYDFLPDPQEPLPELWFRVRWGYGRRLVQSARTLKRYPFLGAVIVTNFGCGPDAFVDQYLEHELADVPHIVLEFDDHHAEAGLVTRLEAFSRNFRVAGQPRAIVSGRDPGKPRLPLREYTYYIPSFMDHAHALAGALRGSGCRAVLLPPTDDESWELGLRHAYGRECHPFISFTGDLLKAAAQPDFQPETACYYGPSYFGPCLLPQYSLALSLILDRVGLGGVTVMNIADPTNMRELGIPYLLRLAFGLYAIDRLFKWKTEILPYERHPGEVAAVYGEILQRVENGLATGTFLKTLRHCIRMLAGVPLAETAGDRPKIGIVGDIYTRVNAHSNDHLYARLQEGGFEVWSSSSLIDVSFLGMEQLHAELQRQGKKLSAAGASLILPALRLARWLVDRQFPTTIRTPQERSFPAVAEAAGRYADFWIDKALALNISRIEELHQARADGVLHVMCHNCMLGNITTALMPAIQQDLDSMPMGNLIYEGLKSTHTANRIEAFMHQVASRRQNICGSCANDPAGCRRQ